MSKLVGCRVDQGLAWITLQRPEVRNALSFDTLGQLGRTLDELAGDARVRVVLVTGQGDKAFCAGADLKERVGFDEQQTRAFVARIGDTFAALAALPQPSIAVLNGVAFGGGLELALAADLRVAAEQVSMGLTETSLAIIPGAGGTQRLPRLVGVARAKDLILTARRVQAREALAMGLVDRVAPRDELVSVASALALAIAANGPLAVAAAKQAIDAAAGGLDLAAGLARERELYLDKVLPSEDRLEALAAFRDKRPPRFVGR